MFSQLSDQGEFSNMQLWTWKTAEVFQLANGLSMPQIHLGVYLTSGNETANAVKWALEVRLYSNHGYCHL